MAGNPFIMKSELPPGRCLPTVKPTSAQFSFYISILKYNLFIVPSCPCVCLR